MLPTELSPSLAVRLDMEVADVVLEANGRGTRETRAVTKVPDKIRHQLMVDMARRLKNYANTKLGIATMKYRPGNHIITILIR